MVRILGARWNVKYYELRFYSDYSIAVLEGTVFAEDDTGEEAKLRRQETVWRVGLADRKLDANCTQGGTAINRNCGERLWKYGDYIIFSNVIILCEGENSEEAFKLCDNLIGIIK